MQKIREFDYERVFTTLKNYHVGKRRAIKGKDLCDMLNINPVYLRIIKHKLVCEEHQPIGATTVDGYFFISNREEFEHCINEITSRINELEDLKNGLEIAFYKHNDNKLF